MLIVQQVLVNPIDVNGRPRNFSDVRRAEPEYSYVECLYDANVH